MLEQTRPSATTDTSNGQHAKRVVDSVSSFGDLPDLLLVERARSRDTRAFETLVRRYNRRLYRIARSILIEDHSAEEAVRATHIRAFANLDRYEPAGKFGAWLARLAFNEALSMRRLQPNAAGSDRRAAASASARLTAGVPSISSAATRAEAISPTPAPEDRDGTRRWLENAIDGLPEVFRTVLVLRLAEDLSGVEVAACLGLHETTVRTRLFRAQQRLRTEVARRLRAEPGSIFELSPERCDRIVSQVCSRLQVSATPDPR